MGVWTILFVEMTFVLILCSILLAGGAQTLTIDSQLGTSIEGKNHKLLKNENKNRYDFYSCFYIILMFNTVTYLGTYVSTQVNIFMYKQFLIKS